jgi:hypothetical protein
VSATIFEPQPERVADDQFGRLARVRRIGKKTTERSGMTEIHLAESANCMAAKASIINPNIPEMKNVGRSLAFWSVAFQIKPIPRNKHPAAR